MNRNLPRLLAVLSAVLIAVPGAPVSAAAEPSSPALTWAVQPADNRGPDGRRWIERTLDPGQVVTEHLAVRNLSDRTAVFALKAADGYLTDRGRFNMLPSHQASIDGGTWIQVQPTVTVGPNETEVVQFTITVPRHATPGDHPAGIAATITSAGGSVAVESRVGFRVMMRVSGTITAALAVDGLTATYRPSWNPFAAGTVRVSYTTTNAGSVAVTGAGQVTTTELLGAIRHHTTTGARQLLPGGRQDVELHIDGVWALGTLRTTVDLTPAVLEGDQAGAELRSASATVTVWTLPWPQLILTAALAALALAVRALLRRRRQRLARLLALARDEGRAQAQQAALVGGPPEGPGR
ncbi:hypothetical protein [Catellatospora sichuanensis]|uniref:hypothetical protein n=1 Tax=Catellatospora sichuanensis TaxID=1969805 RepID=UPI001181ED6E|nr:hypothetical protein [Catellatospora sichuanensis]